MRFEIFAGVVLQVGVMLVGCRSTVEASARAPGVGEFQVKATVDRATTTVAGPAGVCVKITFLGEDGRPLGEATGTTPLTVTEAPGTTTIRVEPCPPSKLVLSGGRAPRRDLYGYMTLPSQLDFDRDHFLVASVSAYSTDEALGLYSALESSWTSLPPNPLVEAQAMVELEASGNELLITIAAPDDILRLDLAWNGQAYAQLADATLRQINGWHLATFRIPASDIHVPSAGAAQNEMSYVMDTASRTGLSFTASAVFTP